MKSIVDELRRHGIDEMTIAKTVVWWANAEPGKVMLIGRYGKRGPKRPVRVTAGSSVVTTTEPPSRKGI
jgi:hypothetical protein